MYNSGYPPSHGQPPPPGQPYYPPGPVPGGYPPPPPAASVPASGGVPPQGPFYPNAAYPAPPQAGYPLQSQHGGYPPKAPPPSSNQAPPPIGFVPPPPLPQGYNSQPGGAPYGSNPYPSGPGAPPPPSSAYPGAPPPPGSSAYPGAPPPPSSSAYPGAPPPPGSSAYPGGPPPPSSSAYPGAPSGASYPGQPAYNPSAPYGQTQYPGGLYPQAQPKSIPEVDIVAPSIKPVHNFSAQQDCEALRKAMKGLGTDEAVLINVLCRRNWQQRAEIERTYKQMFGKNLEKEIHGETSGNFRKVLERLLKTPVELSAFELRQAVEGLGTDEDCLVEIICTKSNAELDQIKRKYSEMYRRSLEKDIIGDTSGHFRRLLVALLSTARDESPHVNWAAAAADARALYEAGAKRLGTDESRFNAVLCSRSYRQLRAVFEAYKRDYKKDIEAVIRSEFSGDIASGLIAVVSVIRNKQSYFANRLHASMVGAGTRDTMLVRIMVSRADFDLAAIKVEYQRLYGRSLSQAIASDTSGDYKRALLALLGE